VEGNVSRERDGAEAREECARLRHELEALEGDVLVQIEGMVVERDRAVEGRRVDIERIVRDTTVEMAAIEAGMVEEAEGMVVRAREDCAREGAGVAEEEMERMRVGFRVREEEMESRLVEEGESGRLRVRSMERELKESRYNADNRLETLRRDLEHEITVKNDEIRRLGTDMRREREVKGREVDRINSQWADTLTMVESKVKLLIAAKDEQIDDEAEKARAFEQKAKTFENLVSTLENGFDELPPSPSQSRTSP